MSLPFVHYLKNEVKKEIKIKIFRQKFSQNELHQFSENDLTKAQWTEESEFILNDDLYDVVKIKLENGQKIYYCFQDKKETKIADLENKIHDLFSDSMIKKTQAKSFTTVSVKINNVSPKVDNSFSHLSKEHLLKSQLRNHFASFVSSDFIAELIIPPEV